MGFRCCGTAEAAAGADRDALFPPKSRIKLPSPPRALNAPAPPESPEVLVEPVEPVVPVEPEPIKT